MIKGGAKAGVGRIAVCLRRGGLVFCISRAGESSVAGDLARAGVDRRHRPAIRMKVPGSSGRGIDAVVSHEQRREDALEQHRGGALE
jgi:hypothetical protein